VKPRQINKIKELLYERYQILALEAMIMFVFPKFFWQFLGSIYGEQVCEYILMLPNRKDSYQTPPWEMGLLGQLPLQSIIKVGKVSTRHWENISPLHCPCSHSLHNISLEG